MSKPAKGLLDRQKHAFPSPRQLKAPGLRREFYPAFLREMVDCDYLDELSEEARVWFAAFLEEHYKGWRLANETQVCPVEHIRQSAADAKRQREHEEPMAFFSHRGPSLDSLVEEPLQDISRNRVEDELIEQIDRHRARMRRLLAVHSKK
jgi:hypothetical protein